MTIWDMRNPNVTGMMTRIVITAMDTRPSGSIQGNWNKICGEMKIMYPDRLPD